MLSPEHVQSVAETFRMLGDPTRVKILDALGAGELCVNDLAARVGISESAVSHQLRLLRHLGLVIGERRGRRIVYALHDSHVADLLDQAVFHIDHVRLGYPERVEEAS